MAKLLNTTFLVTQSAPATPSSGFGTLFASGSSVYYKNSNGNTYDLTINGSSSYSIYTTSGTYNYTVLSNIKYIKVVCISGGGGGGTGARNVVSSYRNGGAGGAGGNINTVYYTSESLSPGDYTITVGAGGAGGLQNSSTGTGGAGSQGNPSSFSSASINLVRALGGVGGSGGGSNAVAGVHVGGTNLYPTTGSTGTFNPYPLYYFAGCDGGSTGGGVVSGVRGTALGGARWLAAGGAGGGINNTNITSSAGSGSAIYSYNTLIQSGSPGFPEGVDGNNGAPVIDISCLLFASGSGITTGVKIGTGGHGGAVGNGASSSGKGGSGSLGAGGGGGGGCLSTAGLSALPGGKGGDGCVLIFEYY